jgi:hypothetical protein
MMFIKQAFPRFLIDSKKSDIIISQGDTFQPNKVISDEMLIIYL